MLAIILLFLFSHSGQIFLPIDIADRRDVNQIILTDIGGFGLMRNERPGIPAHYHTGIDIKRPGNNYVNEPVFPIAHGRVISKRTDGPFANLIIEHEINGMYFWSLYEHIAGISVSVNDFVNVHTPVARYMTREELNRYGWQFDHIHLEILKVRPQRLQPDKKHPERFFNSYSLICYNTDDLEKFYYNPLEFLSKFMD